ncbi:unnamed protein product, partial [Scytosiphon promiscuus]
GEGGPSPAAAAGAAASTASIQTVSKAPPVPPAFLGTVIIDAISVMLLEDSGYSQDGVRTTRGDGTAGGVEAGTGGAPHGRPASPPGATAAAVSAARPLRPALSPRRRSAHGGRRRDAGARGHPAGQRRYSSLICLEIKGIGVGVDLPPPGATAARSPTAGEAGGSAWVDGPRRQDEKQRQCCAEFAIKRVSLTDVSGKRRRQGPLVRLVSDGPATGTASSSARSEGSHERDGDEEGDNDARVLPEGWWHSSSSGADGSGDGAHGGDGEQVLVRVSLCPATGTATADARLSSARLMLLPEPLLEVLEVVSGVSGGIAGFSRSGGDADGLGREGGGTGGGGDGTGARSTGVPAARLATG